MKQSQFFSAKEIPEYINELKDFKKWRFMDSSFQGAALLGVLENNLLQNKIDLVQKMIQRTGKSNVPSISNMRKILVDALLVTNGNQQLDFIIDALKNKDLHNYYLQAFMIDYLKNLKGHEISDDQLHQDFYQYFNLRLILIKKDSNNMFKIDAKNKDCVIVYKDEGKYYVVCQNTAKQQPNCSFCQKQVGEQSMKMKCQHTILCFQCLNRFFNSSHNKINCKEKQCSQTITWASYQEAINNQMATSQMKSSFDATNQCHKCFDSIGSEFLFLNKACSHRFCRNCLENSFSKVSNSVEFLICIQIKCSARISCKEVLAFLGISNGLQKSNSVIGGKTEQKTLKQSSSQITPSGGFFNEVYFECSFCLKSFRPQFMFEAICNHRFCQSCCDKNSNLSQFKCGQRDCANFIKTQDVQDYFYKLIQKQVFSTCSSCNAQIKKSEALTNDCDHFLCFDCASQIYQSKASLKCQECFQKINEQLLDEYILQKTMQQSQIVTETVDVELTNCTFCHSPFTEYNLQQNLICQQHLVGTCCIIFPLDCPQCQIPSLLIEKQKLKFRLQSVLLDGLDYYPETPTRQKLETSFFN